MQLNLHKLQKKINIKFKNTNLLYKSMTHKSFDSKNNNEKLEFLGDRVLGLIISKKLLEIYPDDKEGILDKKLASLVNKEKCLEISKSLNLEKFILVGNNRNKNQPIENKIIADCCESLIGAIYLDQGFNVVEKFIIKIWSHQLKQSVNTYIDPKTLLQEHSLKKYKKLPIYKLIKNSGPRHKPLFEVGVKLHNSKYFISKGSSKKDAEQKAAKLLLSNIGIL
tara:strand:+ start:1255 stop:1923 length:669 start_codon:yes stop_codon:yes gene_type:complete